jgi:large subunit ribosomal protein L21
MNMYAVIKTGGKQYKVSVDDEIFVEKLEGEAGSQVTFEDVLAVSDDNGIVQAMLRLPLQARSLSRARTRRLSSLSTRLRRATEERTATDSLTHVYLSRLSTRKSGRKAL